MATKETAKMIEMPATDGAKPGEAVQMVAPRMLVESGTNPRRSFDDGALAELVASIRVSGLQVPLLARPVSGMVELELICGARRLRAARELDLPAVPCLVREMTDEEAREAQIVENLQREGVHQIEEAEAFEALRVQLGSVPAVAARVGKEQSYVAKCLRLRALTEHSRRATREGLITVEHALLLARLAEREQNDALKWTLDRNAGSKKPVEKVLAERLERVAGEKKEGRDQFRSYAGWEPESVKQLKARIENESGTDLKRAPWKLDDAALLPAAGPCATCEKNTKANTPLFGDLAIDEQRCVDGACYGEKTQAFVILAQMKAGQDLSADDKNVIPRLSWRESSVKPALSEDHLRMLTAAGMAKQTANPTRLLKRGQWVEAKKGSCPNVRPGVTADWSDAGQRGYGVSETKLRKPGETLLVCIAAGCKVHKKAWEKTEGKSNGGASEERYDPVKAQRERELADRVAKVETRLRVKVFSAILGKMTAASVVRIVAQGLHDSAVQRKEIVAEFPAAKGELLDALVILRSQYSHDLRANGYSVMSAQNLARDRKDMWSLAKAAGVDADAVAVKYFAEEGVAPDCERLLPKGAKLPKVGKSKAKPAADVKPAKKGHRAAPPKLSAEARKKVAAGLKARLAALHKSKAKKKAKVA